MCLGMTWLVMNRTSAVQCSDDGNRWEFMECDYSVLLFFLHNFTTIMCAAVVRYVLVKSDKREYCGWNALADVKNDI